MDDTRKDVNETKTEEQDKNKNDKGSSSVKSDRRKKRKGKRSLAKAEKEIEILNEKLRDTEQKLEKTYVEMVEYKNRFLRAMADLDNYRKSVQKEIEEARTRTKESLYLDIISILDNFERAMQSFKKDNIDEHTMSIIKGIEMIYKQFHNLLEKEGVKAYSSIGERFDPRKHHAMMHKEAEGVESDQILEEYEKGYMYGDKILRPAKVIVSKKKENNIEDKEEKNNGEE